MVQLGDGRGNETTLSTTRTRLLRCEHERNKSPCYTSGMVSLTKILDDKPVIADALPNEQVVRCPRCEQTYGFGHSENEWHRLGTWLKKAESAMRESHKKGHEQEGLELIW